ncbi:MAG: flagellar FlbD family protein [Clostridia bacterium]|nr:flagellar FlbD family protein [Clostridia bacterium]
MIRVNALSGKEITINAELIETVENMPETLITLINGKKLLVRESQEEITELVLEYRRLAYTPAGVPDGFEVR